MIRLIKLEMQRINLRNSLMTSFILGIVVLIFTYFVANVAQIEHKTEFMNYGNILRFSCVIGIILFGILSAVMSNELVIKEYSGKRLALLFSYPVNRKKIFLGKVWIILLFAFLSTLLAVGIPITIFLVTESIKPIVSDIITINLLVDTFGMIAFSALSVSAIGVFAMGIGFIRKSITVTLISALLLAGVYGNIAIRTGGNLLSLLYIIGASFIGVTAVIIMLSSKINHMEAE